MWIVGLILTMAFVTCTAIDIFYVPRVNVTRTPAPGIAQYRSMLTLDWLAAEDSRQKELMDTFKMESYGPSKFLSTNCVAYPRPAPGKIGKLMVELMRNLEGDNGNLIMELTHNLIESHILMETSSMDDEPDLESLVKTPGIMMGEPHVTFPKIIAMAWLAITDPVITKKNGWCSIKKVNTYLAVAKPVEIARQMRILDPMLDRARFVIEDFIHSVTPLNMYEEAERKSLTKEHMRKKTYSTNKGMTVTRTTLHGNKVDKKTEIRELKENIENREHIGFLETLPEAVTLVEKEDSGIDRSRSEKSDAKCTLGAPGVLVLSVITPVLFMVPL